MLSLPYFAGYSYFMFLDQPASGISETFREDSNYGLVSESGVPYREITAAFRALHADLSAARSAPTPEAEASGSGAVAPSERERYLAAAREAGSVPGASAPGPVAFAREGDRWVLSNGLVRLSGRVGGKYMADEIAYGGAPAVGRWGALLQGLHDGIPYWVDATRVTDVTFKADEATGIGSVTIRAEGGAKAGVAGGSVPEGVRFAFTHRLSLAPGSAEVLAEILSLENTGPEPFETTFLFMRPFAVEKEPRETRSVPNLWKGPVEGYWLLSDGSRWGIESHDPGVMKASLWRKEGTTSQHPDVRCREDGPFVLAPGAAYHPGVPMAARIRFQPQ